MSETQDSESSTAEKRPHDEMEDDLESKRHRSSSHDAGYERGHHGGRGGGHGEKYEIRILIPSHTAGAIIGKGGSNIRDLRHEFNASIQVPDSQGFERVVAAVTTTKEDAANLCGKIVDALCERMHQQDRFSTLKMLVHKSQAGTIIGLKGSRIKELREITGAYIKVNQECCP
uniref:K Homology domain-containing protein n=1 Tax=Ciona savignyi TaxID=51511 RepID=H2ZIC9_CIOSA